MSDDRALLSGGPLDGRTVNIDGPADLIHFPRYLDDDFTVVHDVYKFAGNGFRHDGTPYPYEYDGQQAVRVPDLSPLVLTRRERTRDFLHGLRELVSEFRGRS